MLGESWGIELLMFWKGVEGWGGELAFQPFGTLEKEEELCRYFSLVGELLSLVVTDSPPRTLAFSSQELLKHGLQGKSW